MVASWRAYQRTLTSFRLYLKGRRCREKQTASAASRFTNPHGRAQLRSLLHRNAHTGLMREQLCRFCAEMPQPEQLANPLGLCVLGNSSRLLCTPHNRAGRTVRICEAMAAPCPPEPAFDNSFSRDAIFLHQRSSQRSRTKLQ
jgi:hypothetical protein